MSDLPANTIVIWAGAIIDIPPGYLLCDGTAGTPDLRDRFVQGAGGALNPDDTGGTVNHLHPFTGDGHNHTLAAGAGVAAGAALNSATTTDPVNGTTAATNNIPPFYALAYIMKS